jgi:hypothetical protein
MLTASKCQSRRQCMDGCCDILQGGMVFSIPSARNREIVTSHCITTRKINQEASADQHLCWPASLVLHFGEMKWWTHQERIYTLVGWTVFWLMESRHWSIDFSSHQILIFQSVSAFSFQSKDSKVWPGVIFIAHCLSFCVPNWTSIHYTLYTTMLRSSYWTV